MSLIVKTARTAISTWLSANGVDPKTWAPWVAMDHYLSRKGTDLDLSKDKLIVALAARAIENGVQAEDLIFCDYSCSLPMQTKTPYLGQYIQGQFNELTATVGGFTAQDMGDYYLIVDRYDWYNTGVLIDLPTCIRPLVDKAPKWLKEKLGVRGYSLNQGAMPQLGVAFNTIIKVPKDLDCSWLTVSESGWDVESNNNKIKVSGEETENSWKEVVVGEEIAEKNKDQIWSGVGDTYDEDECELYRRSEESLTVVLDDIYGGYAVAAEICCLLEDKPEEEEYSIDEEFTEHRSDGLYVVYDDEDFGFEKPTRLPYTYEEGVLRVLPMRLIKRRKPELFKELVEAGWHPAEDI